MTPETRRKLEVRLKRTHQLAREALADFLMLDPARVPLEAVKAEGLDAEIAVLCEAESA